METSDHQLTYTQAMDELQAIANTLENENLDPDQMVTLVKRAEILVNFCKSRLAETEKSVQDILNRLQENEQNEPSL